MRRTVKLSRAALQSERTVEPQPDVKIGPIHSTRSGVGYSAVLGGVRNYALQIEDTTIVLELKENKYCKAILLMALADS